MYDIIIIGAGIAGLTASIYARRAGKKVLVVEASSYGGQIINSPNIENFPSYDNVSGIDLMRKTYRQAERIGVEFVFNKVYKVVKKNDVFLITTDDGDYEANCVILASGTQNRRIGLEHESEFMSRGISYCVSCDGALYKDKVVAVYGGGYTAVSGACYLADICQHVYLIHRRNKLRAVGMPVERLRDFKNAETVLSSTIVRLNGDDKLESITLATPEGEKNLKVDALFVTIGREPNVNFIDGVDKDEEGYIIAGEDCKTNIPGLFVAGDIRTKKLRQLVTAASDGAVAATEAIEYLQMQ